MALLRLNGQMGSRLHALLVAMLLTGCATIIQGCDDQTTDTFSVKIGGEWFTLETAYTLEKRAKGLMHRESVPENGGMIFIFNDARERSFWMKNCLVDIDILYLDRANRILTAYRMKAQPPQGEDESELEYEDRIRRTGDYPSNGPSQIVIELKAGKIAELGLRRGQKIDLDPDHLKTLIELADDTP